MSDTPDFDVQVDESTGQVAGVTLYGQQLLDTTAPCESELYVNGQALPLRPHVDPNDPTRELKHLKGERFVDHFSGWGLVVARHMGGRTNVKHPCFGIQTRVRRELCDQTMHCPGPGGPTVEAPLHVDSFSVLNWNWQFWGEDTRMVFASLHSGGPADEAGHVGYENDTPEACKGYLQNVMRRLYPGTMAIHGGLFYNAKTGHWLAITCRQPTVGYIVNIDDAGRGVSYDFTLHAPFPLGDSLRLPEIVIYYGADEPSRQSWLADYVTQYYEEPPEWVYKTHFMGGLAWNNAPTWTQQADAWEEALNADLASGISYSLVTNRPVKSGTTPLGYEPDPLHGSKAEFKAMCRRLADRGVPLLVWMSHSGLSYQGGDEIDDDWFIRGIDGRTAATWGSIDAPELAAINPGHPGYIEYTKKWIRFYIKECGCKGIFFDCLGWHFPPDFTPRSWMRYPGDTNRMAIRFMNEVYACIKECDPEAIMIGEGTTLEGPVNGFTIHSNPVRAIDGKGPREFLLDLNHHGSKRLVLDQGPRFFPGGGYSVGDSDPAMDAMNRYMTRLLRNRGGARAITHLPGPLSVLDDLLIVPAASGHGDRAPIVLPPPYDDVTSLTSEIDGKAHAPVDGRYPDLPTGVYRMHR